MKKVYFPNLNGLRFIAALLVIIHHTEQFKIILGLDNYWNSFVFLIGRLGVVLFFVLSGFLITYLLLTENKQTGKISIKDFYIRRLLRIWPLYYLILILGFFVFPSLTLFSIENWTDTLYQNFFSKLLLFIFFLPNLALAMHEAVPYASQSWSIGVEEQFYLIWPLLIKFVKRKEIVLYLIIGIYVFMNIIGFKLISVLFSNPDFLDILRVFWGHFNIDCMAIGGLFALYYFQRRKIIKFIFHKYVQIANILLLTGFIALGVRIPFIHYEFYSVLFGILLINLAANKNSILNLENKILNYLGKISYGLYMFHPIAIVLSLKFLLSLSIDNIILQYTLSILLAIAIASFSYFFFERYFIKLKIKYSKIISGDNVNANIKLKNRC